MTQLRAAAGLMVVAAVAGACAHPAQTPTAEVVSQESSQVATCGATSQGVDVSAWREVAAKGFTFCVPRDWHGRGRSWRRGSAEINWGTGVRPRGRLIAVVDTVPASEVGMIPDGPRNGDLRRFTEQIDGRRATTWRNRFGQDYYTGAEWESDHIWLTGEAKDGVAADLQLAIFRTVRFRSY